MRFIYLILLSLFPIMGFAQQTITFPSSDGLSVTASLYVQDKSFPFIILFHQANYSRGEYIETAPRLMKLGYNCLAVDLRSGKEVNFIQNETATRAREKILSTNYLDAEKDMLAAIEFLKQSNKKGKFILFGSSYSASLALKIAKNNPSVSAVVAFSPGEYFQPQLSIKKQIAGLDKPLFIACTSNEYPFVKELFSDVSDNLITWWTPSKGAGTHGSSALWQSNAGNGECWLSLLIFFKNLK